MRDVVAADIGVGECAVAVVGLLLDSDQENLISNIFICYIDNKIVVEGCQIKPDNVFFAVISADHCHIDLGDRNRRRVDDRKIVGQRYLSAEFIHLNVDRAAADIDVVDHKVQFLGAGLGGRWCDVRRDVIAVNRVIASAAADHVVAVIPNNGVVVAIRTINRIGLGVGVPGAHLVVPGSAVDNAVRFDDGFRVTDIQIWITCDHGICVIACIKFWRSGIFADGNNVIATAGYKVVIGGEIVANFNGVCSVVRAFELIEGDIVADGDIGGI